MTDEEIEKQSEEYAKSIECCECYPHEEIKGIMITLYDDEQIKQAFQDGAKWGMEHAIEWHDLRKNSNDLPKEVNKFIIIALYNYITEEIITTVGTYEEFGDMLIGNVIAWCELPQFKDKE